MAKKYANPALPAKLYDKPRYSFDETHLFYHWKDAEEQTDWEKPTFPYFKPKWNGNYWDFYTDDGKQFPYDKLAEGKHIWPEYFDNLTKAAAWAGSPAFAIAWLKMIVHYKGVVVFGEAEAALMVEFPDKRPDQLARMCDDKVQEFFNSLKA